MQQTFPFIVAFPYGLQDAIPNHTGNQSTATSTSTSNYQHVETTAGAQETAEQSDPCEPAGALESTGAPAHAGAGDCSHQVSLDKLVSRLSSHLESPFVFHTGHLLHISFK